MIYLYHISSPEIIYGRVVLLQRSVTVRWAEHILAIFYLSSLILCKCIAVD